MAIINNFIKQNYSNAEKIELKYEKELRNQGASELVKNRICLVQQDL